WTTFVVFNVRILTKVIKIAKIIGNFFVFQHYYCLYTILYYSTTVVPIRCDEIAFTVFLPSHYYQQFIILLCLSGVSGDSKKDEKYFDFLTAIETFCRSESVVYNLRCTSNRIVSRIDYQGYNNWSLRWYYLKFEIIDSFFLKMHIKHNKYRLGKDLLRLNRGSDLFLLQLELQKHSILFRPINNTKHGSTNRPNVSITLQFKEYNIICKSSMDPGDILDFPKSRAPSRHFLSSWADDEGLLIRSDCTSVSPPRIRNFRFFDDSEANRQTPRGGYTMTASSSALSQSSYRLDVLSEESVSAAITASAAWYDDENPVASQFLGSVRIFRHIAGHRFRRRHDDVMTNTRLQYPLSEPQHIVGLMFKITRTAKDMQANVKAITSNR
ncbi:hypothetical protein AGLY_004793, partial [Aphis glycines]